MSADYTLTDEFGHAIVLPERNMEQGGTYPLGGTDFAEFNVTYNYSRIWAEAWPDESYAGMLDSFEGKRAGDLIPTMEAVVEKLGTEQSDDYWEPTPGNAGYAMNVLLGWARQFPDGVWSTCG